MESNIPKTPIEKSSPGAQLTDENPEKSSENEKTPGSLQEERVESSSEESKVPEVKSSQLKKDEEGPKDEEMKGCEFKEVKPSLEDEERKDVVMEENVTVVESIQQLEEERQNTLKTLKELLKAPDDLKNIDEIASTYEKLKRINQQRIDLKSENDEKQLDCALGAVIGAFIGDSLGSAVEFKKVVTDHDLEMALSMQGGVFGNGPGQVTDDSELAMCLLKGISETLPRWDADFVAKYYRKWIMSSPFDIGMTTRSALGSLPQYKEIKGLSYVAKRDSSINNQNSLSNGSFMRSSPLAVFCRHFDPELIRLIVTEDSSMTHSNRIIHETETLYIICISHLIQNPQDREGAIKKVFEYAENHCGDAAKSWLHNAFSPEMAMPGSPNMGYVKIAFDHSFRELTRESINYTESMKRVLLLGGDTDTNAAIVGAIIGAYVGYKGLPQEWKEKVERFYGESGIKRPLDFLDQREVKKLVEEIFWNCP